MKHLLFLISLLYSLNSCNVSSNTVLTPNDRIVIFPTTNYVDGRQTFSVIVNNRAYDYMYPEEIAQALKTGVWEYNEDLSVSDSITH